MINFNNPESAKIKAIIEDRLKDDVEGLKSPILDHDQTQVLRGRIALAEELLELGQRPETE